MSNYELITNAIMLAPLLAMILVGLALSKERASIRISSNVVAGWIAIIAFTLVYWHYAIEYAPTIELKHELTLKDGGAKTGSIFFGWIYSLAFVLLFEAFRWLTIRVSSILRKSNKASVVDAKDAQHN